MEHNDPGGVNLNANKAAELIWTCVKKEKKNVQWQKVRLQNAAELIKRSADEIAHGFWMEIQPPLGECLG